MKTKDENTVPSIWTAQQNLIHFYKMVALGFGAFSVLLAVFAMLAYFKDPIVVVRSTHGQDFFPAQRAAVSVQTNDVEQFVKSYLTLLYVWESFDPKKLSDEIGPFSEDGLVPKILESQIQKFGKITSKKLSQDLSFVSVKVLKDQVLCSFMRVLKIEGIPLVVPTQLSLHLIEGSRTKSNPMGVYVSGITESESAK